MSVSGTHGEVSSLLSVQLICEDSPRAVLMCLSALVNRGSGL